VAHGNLSPWVRKPTRKVHVLRVLQVFLCTRSLSYVGYIIQGHVDLTGIVLISIIHEEKDVKYCMTHNLLVF
jgi:hypothetical protein